MAVISEALNAQGVPSCSNTLPIELVLISLNVALIPIAAWRLRANDEGGATSGRTWFG